MQAARKVTSANDHRRIIDALQKCDKTAVLKEMQRNWMNFAE
jgi:DNA-binding FadR family transcriptional regulator